MTSELLAFETTGDGPAILFIHGLTFSRQTWDPVIERLQHGFRCVAVDLPGHGESTGSGSDPRAVCARLYATADAAGIHEPVVVGHSAGGLMATGYASLYPTSGVVNVDQMLLVSPFASFLKQYEPALRGPDFQAAFAPFVASMALDRLPERERQRVTATQRIDRDVVLDHWTGPLTTEPPRLQAEVDGLLDEINVAYLLLAGEAVSPAERDHLLEHLPTATIEQWPGDGHMLHLLEPDRFAERVAAFTSSALTNR